MEPLILNGSKVATDVKEQLKIRVEALKEQGVTPCLATVLVGDDPSSATYVKMKGNACAKIGMESRKIHLPAETTTEELLAVLDGLNDDSTVHGILLQHPVPSQIDERAAFERISIEKDVDGVTSHGFGQNALGFGEFPSCTPAAIMEIIDYYNVDPKGKHAVVVGRSPILGKPVSMMLLNRNATVTTCHSYTENLPALLADADIVVAAVGKPNFIQGDWLKEGAIVLDAGYNPGNVGDIDYESCYAKASAITPVPGGVGPVTISMLLKQTVDAAEKYGKTNS
ncbi:bifunctional 5,10-methylenetetrahydrofolate dehydrogenase/5,10-methenyltetrahydrofolate cyclohydrolase [Rossellomorea marisflavi]|uniref:bifunctional 5,10-methylenetetrahydrofolate dehydrogenase/5,10-methenyltetrahydrofolate cyclohydrolase n=1 Tax=Rossellomorea TaxID=2837508 RepID=UPI00064E2930|nr:tetrahydrofolate dehydrogenase/cyclohydrolase catalytic domain-containing protein [Rossellomorea marisflavi]KMK95807.1 5,10-methylene-tetrahydrofolate cyclohydrolase [Rossellomorea marisflavi]KML01215.1 5,10-methylene-tetrahydrofolate cyclohydrolase [Rossellomorea marisflavi]QHA38086.1 bifunctional 5,10-methylene-tetrahydrofolate dehydrogenase/5,10-methylene-tetrahydrofolate cyclohydrolase [Rossellomorea marisflavi]TYO74170.1 bifunctional 5,10-methylene-tetrahydrofolate dehydrogenase/5,10-me